MTRCVNFPLEQTVSDLLPGEFDSGFDSAL